MVYTIIQFLYFWIYFTASYIDFGNACQLFWCSDYQCTTSNRCHVGNICWRRTFDLNIALEVKWYSQNQCQWLASSCFCTPELLQQDLCSLRILGEGIYLTSSVALMFPLCNSTNGRLKNVTVAFNFRPPLRDPDHSSSFCFQGDTPQYGWVAIECGSVLIISSPIAASEATFTTSTSIIVQSSSRTSYITPTTVEQSTQSASTTTHTPTVATQTQPQTTTLPFSLLIPTTVEQGNMINVEANVKSKKSGSLNVTLAAGISVGVLLMIGAASIAACIYLKRRKPPPQAILAHRGSSNDDARYVSSAQMEALNVHFSISAIHRSTESGSTQKNTPEYAVLNRNPRNSHQYINFIPDSGYVGADSDISGPDTDVEQGGSVVANGQNSDKPPVEEMSAFTDEYMNCGAKADVGKRTATRGNVMQHSGDDEYTRFEDNDLYHSGGIKMENFSITDQNDVFLSTNEADTYLQETSTTENVYANSTGEQNICFVDNDLYVSD